jgi:DNA modification methylase
MEDSRYQIIEGDCIQGMKTLPDGCVHTIVTSPPYYGLRDYDGGEAEIGGEETPDDYVKKMVEVFREAKRILRDDGTLWLNLGDTYATTSGGMEQLRKLGDQTPNYGAVKYSEGYKGVSQKGKDGAKKSGLKHKDLIGIPWRVALALQADGWYLRQDIIWNKPNPMPESVTDRCTKSHEYIFLLTKQPKYYYDNEAIKEPATTSPAYRDKHGEGYHADYPNGDRFSPGERVWGADGKRNKRSVWTVTTKAYKGAHFATYPKDLIEPCVLAGTSEHGCCCKCGTPWIRKVETARSFESGSGKSDNLPEGKNGKNLQGGGETKDIRRGPVCHTKTIGWESACSCEAEVVPCTVFDPFTGSGTTAVVALNHGRKYIGTELNPEYIKLAEGRIAEEAPLTLLDFLA